MPNTSTQRWLGGAERVHWAGLPMMPCSSSVQQTLARVCWSLELMHNMTTQEVAMHPRLVYGQHCSSAFSLPHTYEAMEEHGKQSRVIMHDVHDNEQS